ncbi:MAG: hypothetical protein ACOZCL_05755 [Bacillota bacterium]
MKILKTGMVEMIFNLKRKNGYLRHRSAANRKILMIYPLRSINRRLCKINQRSAMENRSMSLRLFTALSATAVLYMLFALCLFHTLWYHLLLSIFSTAIFVYLCSEYVFESMEASIRNELPSCCKKLAHYYNHYRGNIILAVKAAETKGPEKTRPYMLRLRKALESVNIKEQAAELRQNVQYTWIRMLYMLLVMCKLYGTPYEEMKNTEPDDGSVKKNTESNMFERNLRRITNVLSRLNVEQGYNDAELKGIELFMFASPYFFIMASHMFNGSIMREMNMGNVYGSIEAQTMKALMFFIGNLSALFIHWMRKQQD